jgi:broad specificity phosphatase PhoE
MTGPMQRSLIIVRHGRTVANATGLLLGRADPELDDRGVEQAAAVGRAIESGRFGQIAAVVSSPLLRTRSTAKALSLPVQIDERLIELDYGEWEGRPVAEVSAAEWAAWRSDSDFAPPEGESLAVLGQRMREACADWSSRVLEREGSVVLVSHVSPIKAAVAWALGVGDDVAWRTHLDTASITQVLCRNGTPILSLFNDTSHLDRGSQ